jgi:ribosomal protein S27E
MRCPDCGHEDVRFYRLVGPLLEVICGLCELSLHVVEVDYEQA